jgi:DNA polymerase (family 10)
MDNRTVARKLLDWARSLEAERASLYRVRAYRRAAETILGLDRPIEELVTGGGRKSLKELPGIGGRMSEKIEKLVRTGDISTLNEDGATMVRAPG